ncbi:xanthine dehydrogenase [Salinimicrobium marinum]|uniref:Xanthine dehydrogenase n=1 Tax=Salinimicrobium marinum TaxID=680283 RepID=A0A918SK71_9FLAO|nr:XdhC/CoxI family protein [Salinimicrobium marinum]GHA48153.1 xanthine dehydrogenase [Salinimicrobium marinum]
MTHEFKKIIESGVRNREKGIKSVLATVVALDGSSYRKPGVRMLLGEDGSMTGAVSGGCVEKEVLLQAQMVFQNNQAKMMTYDGRYRLGCEGILYILLEPFAVTGDLQEIFSSTFRERKSFVLESFFKKEDFQSVEMGSLVHFGNGKTSAFSDVFQLKDLENFLVFEQEMKPPFKMIIIGSEHDAVQMCSAAALMGWEVQVIASPKDPRSIENFPGAGEVLHLTPEETTMLAVDEETAVILMNHNYARDLQFLLAIKDKSPVYIGLLGAVKRREQLFNELIEFHPEIDYTFLDKIHGPAGLDIGAITPQEIAVSILSEILTVLRKKDAVFLKNKQDKIHN